MKRLWLMGFAALFAACGDSHSGGGGGGGGSLPVAVAYVTVSPDTAELNRIGQRKQLTAAAWDADDNPIPGVAFSWKSDSAAVSVDSTGLATALSAGAADVTATDLTSEDGKSGSATLTATTAVRSDRGIMYTVWTARTDYAPMLIENGRLKPVPGMFGNEQTPRTPWNHPGVEKFQWEGDRLAILSDMAGGAGTLRVLDRRKEWRILGIGNVVDFQLEGGRTAVLYSNGHLLFEGLGNLWESPASGGVKQFQLSGFRTGVLDNDGRLYTRKALGRWREHASAGVEYFQLYGDRIGALFSDGSLRVKDDNTRPWRDPAPWTEVATGGVQHFQLEGNRIGALFSDGSLRVKDGIGGSWTVLANGGVQHFQLEGNRIGALHDDGSLRVKNGTIGPWKVPADTGVRSFLLQGPFIATITDSGWFSIRTTGFFGYWPEEKVEVDQVTQYLAVAPVPDPPLRMTPDSYTANQQQCIQDANAGRHCDHVSHFSVPVAHYGRFCGGGVPSDEDLGWARSSGPMDPFDNLCRHHDNASFYYPNIDTGPADACVVRYGIEHGRLTRDGRELSSGTAEWDWAWGFMPNLLDTIENYDWYTGSVCWDSDLATFANDTNSIY